jgi:hypothetical protein
VPPWSAAGRGTPTTVPARRGADGAFAATWDDTAARQTSRTNRGAVALIHPSSAAMNERCTKPTNA